MSDAIYTPLIDDMVWSYSRLSTFDDCPYRWFMKYIADNDTYDRFYASYGSFIHKLLEGFYNKKLNKEDLYMKFLLDFSKDVKGVRPSEAIVKKYIDSGKDYFTNFTSLPFELIDVEKKVTFNIKGYNLVGFIDYVGCDSDGFIIIDHKSRDLKPRSKRKKPTLKDKELDEMFKQLYIYSAAIKQEFGEYPKKLGFNCFRNGNLIIEPFDIDKYNEACEWVVNTINKIRVCEDFYPNYDFFVCKHICDVSEDCIYCQQMERR